MPVCIGPCFSVIVGIIGNFGILNGNTINRYTAGNRLAGTLGLAAEHDLHLGRFPGFDVGPVAL